MMQGRELDQYKIMHDQGYFPGHSLKAHIPKIMDLIDDTESKSMLDYGCGKGMCHATARWGIPFFLYDPAVSGYADPPMGSFDLVICTDVLEHIPEDELPEVLDELFEYADKHVFMTVCTRPAKKTLPDGRNAHLTVRDEEWWRSLVGSRDVPYTLIFTE